MLVSIIIPFYKGEKFIDNLLFSISQAIKNVSLDYSFEVIVVIDSIETVLKSIKNLATQYFSDLNNVSIKCLKNEVNIGVAASRNKAIKESNGTFLHIIDQDDEVHNQFYALAISKSKTYNFILFNGLINYENKFNSHLWFYISPKLTLNKLLTSDFIRSPGQVFFARYLSNNIIFYENTVSKGTDDRFFWLNIFIKRKLNLKPFYCNKPYYIAHIHNNNFSSNKVEMFKSSLENCDLIFKQNPDLHKNIRFYCHIQSQKFASNLSMSFFDTFLGGITRILYFLELNKFVRFFYKRLL